MTREEALAEAKVTADWEGWFWQDPVRIERKTTLFSRKPFWEVLTNEGQRGDHVRIRIDDMTGEVREKKVLGPVAH